MKRKISVEIKTVKELEAIQLALDDTEIRAFLIVVGTLMPLSKDERIKTLRCLEILYDTQIIK